MPKRADFQIEHLFENDIVRSDVIVRAMHRLGREMERDFRNEVRARQRESKRLSPIRDAVIASIGTEDKIARAVRAIRGSDAKRDVKPPPPRPKERTQVFLGTIGATQALPFDYRWTWHTTNRLAIITESASRTNGHMEFFMTTGSGPQATSGATACAVGIYFRPITDGTLSLSAHPSFWRNWSTQSIWNVAHSEGWLGLYVGRYALDGRFDGSVVHYKTMLWNDYSGWLDSRTNQIGTSPAYPLGATFRVARTNFYALWVWCGGGVSADGWYQFNGSSAAAAMSVSVPSITWRLE